MPGGIDEMKMIEDFIKDPDFAVQPVAETPAPEAAISNEPPQKEISNVVEKTPVEKTDAADIINTPTDKVETPSPEVPPVEVKAPEVDYDKWLGETSNNRLKSKDDLSKILDEYDQTKELLNSDTYQYAAKLSAWEKAGHPRDLFTDIQSLSDDEIKALDPRDLVALKMKFENPKWTADEINLLIDEDYRQDPDSHTENVVKAGKLRMEREANTFRGKLAELKQLTIVPKAEDTRALAQQTENLRKDTWKQNLPKFVGEFNKISIPLDKAGKDVFDWVPTKEQKQELLSEMERIVTNVPVKFDEEGIKAFQTAMRKEFINKNINEISQAIAARATSKKTEEVIKEIHNPTGAKSEPQAPITPAKSEEDIAFDKIVAAEIGSFRR